MNRRFECISSLNYCMRWAFLAKLLPVVYRFNVLRINECKDITK